MPTITEQDHENAILWAQRMLESRNFVVLDTETTGVSKNDEVVSVSIVDPDGAVLLDTLVKPGRVIPLAATNIHGISNIDVLKAPSFADIHPDVARLIDRRTVVAYNVDFDLGMIGNSCRRSKLPIIKPLLNHCAMKWYAKFYGQFNDYGNDYKWHRLGVACARFGIEAHGAHSAVGDCRLTLALMRAMAAAS